MSDHPERAQLDAVLSALDDVLGAAIVGVYLHGSAVLSRIRPRSDLDLFVISCRSTTHDEKVRLTDRLMAVSDREDDARFSRCLELTLVVQADIRPWRYPPPIDFLYGEWLRAEFEQGKVAPDAATDPDLAIVISIVLLADHPLVGPPPAEVLDAVPPADLRRALTDELGGLLEDLDTDTRNIVLTLARVWMTLETGTIGSKDAAADWALLRLPEKHRAVLARARAVYLGDEQERWSDLRERIQPHADHVVAEIRKA